MTTPMGSPQTEESGASPQPGASPTVMLAKSFGQALGSDWDSKKVISSIFEKETKEAVQARKAKGSVVIDLKLRKGRTWDDESYPLILSHPIRPTRDATLGKAQLEKGEEEYFARWCQEVDIQTKKVVDAEANAEARSKQGSPSSPTDEPLFSDEETTGKGKKGGHAEKKLIIDGVNSNIQPIHIFERNLDVWRQLWRTLEQSDTILIVADSRNPSMHIPISLIEEVKGIKSPNTDESMPKKGILLVLTKVDLVSKTHIERWKKYLDTKYPGYFDGIMEFTKQPHKNEQERADFVKNHGIAARKKRFKTLTTMKKSEFTELVNEYTSTIVSKAEELAHNYRTAAVGVENFHESAREFPLTLGCIGHPNVGKSSLLNAIIGSKKLSVSRTAGHTKHIQHIRLTNRAEHQEEDIEDIHIHEEDEHLEVGGCTATTAAGDSKATTVVTTTGGNTTSGNTNATGEHVRPTAPNPNQKRGGGRNARNKKKGGKNIDDDFPTLNHNVNVPAGEGAGGVPDELLSKSERKRLKNNMRTAYKEAQVGFEGDIAAPLAPGTKKKGKSAKKGGGGGDLPANQSNTSNQPALTASTLTELEQNTERLTPKFVAQQVDGSDDSDDQYIETIPTGKVKNASSIAPSPSSMPKTATPGGKLLTYTPSRGPTSVPAHSPSSAASNGNVDRVMDCPGLVFPSPHRPLHLSELSGLLPIAQIRETYSAIRYLAERVPLEKYYGLEDDLVREYRERSGQDDSSGGKHRKGKHDKASTDDYALIKEQALSTMTPITLLEAFCEKRKMFLANTASPDLHRAGLEIIRDCVDGVVVLAVEPPD